MNHFAYRDGVLCAEAVPLEHIAAEVGTPFYCYSTATLTRHYKVFAEAFAGMNALVCYAMKANSNQAVIKTLAKLGAGADVVSGGELKRARAAGIPPERIVFSGIGKTATEMEFALAHDVRQINVESVPELILLSAMAQRMGRTAPVAIRVNPDVDARTHEKIATGKKENKFGIDLAHAAEALRRATTLPGIAPVGLALHIGSQLTELAPFELAFTRVAALFAAMRDEGIALERLDLGGGVGIRYRDEQPPPFQDYAALVKRLTDGLGAELAFEPGRAIVGNAGALLARVIYVKDGVTRRFVIIDAAMNDLVRPALYDAWHAILPVAEAPPGTVFGRADLVGPVCETGDSFAAGRPLPPLADGDLLALMSAGAYGAVMSSEYNTRLLVPEVLVGGDEFAVVRVRPSYESVLAQDRLPPWLAEH